MPDVRECVDKRKTTERTGLHLCLDIVIGRRQLKAELEVVVGTREGSQRTSTPLVRVV